MAHIGVALDKSKLGVNKDPEHRPMLDFLSTQKRLEPLFSRTMQALGLSYPQAAESATIATAILIKQCVPVLDPNLAFGIAAYGFVEGSKTAPDPVVLAAVRHNNSVKRTAFRGSLPQALGPTGTSSN
jgi:hypothetical protein